jgi:hypothetical protein
MLNFVLYLFDSFLMTNTFPQSSAERQYRLTALGRNRALRAARPRLQAGGPDGGRFGLYSWRPVSGTMSAAEESGGYFMEG